MKLKSLIVLFCSLVAAGGAFFALRPRENPTVEAQDPIAPEKSSSSTMGTKEDPAPVGAASKLTPAELPNEASPLNETVSAEVTEAREKMRQGQPEEAVRLLQKKVASDPTDTAAWIELGMAQDTVLKKPDQAEATFREWAERQPGSAAAHATLGGFLVSKGRHDEAAVSLKKATESSEARAEDYLQLARNQAARGLAPEAKATFEKAYEAALQEKASAPETKSDTFAANQTAGKAAVDLGLTAIGDRDWERAKTLLKETEKYLGTEHEGYRFFKDRLIEAQTSESHKESAAH